MERLGLHLESAVAPVEEIVIDSVRRPTLTSTVPTQHRAASGPFDPARNPSQDLLAVIKEAKPQHKNILLDVGGNWCGWCLLLDQSMHDEAEVHARLDHFIVLHINYSAQNENKHFLARYPRPRGYPFWYVLSPEGRLLTAKSPESFQISDDAYAYDQSKINAFLDRWRTDLSHVGGK
jgi:thiol:disulfide interchange protein